MQPLLPLIERLSLYPAETLLAVPVPPDAALRGVLVLQGLARQIEIEAEALRRDQAELDAAVEGLRQEPPKLIRGGSDAETRTRCAGSGDRHGACGTGSSGSPGKAGCQPGSGCRRPDGNVALRIDRAWKRSGVRMKPRLREDAARAERQNTLPKPRRHRNGRPWRRIRVGTGAITGRRRAAGSIAAAGDRGGGKGWGEQTDGGPSTGVSYYAPSAARVIVPLWRTRGVCRELPQLRPAADRRLRRRLPCRAVRLRTSGCQTGTKPCGGRAGWDHAEMGTGSAARRPALYVELRHDGAPVNPAPWLRPSS